MNHTTNTFKIPHPQTRSAVRGFTLIETMLVVAILGILSVWAAVNVRPMVERWRVRQASESMIASLHMARSVALRQGGMVAIKKGDGLGGSCSTWGCGWHVALLDSTGQTTDVVQALFVPRDVTLNVNQGGAALSGDVAFNQWGRVQGANDLSFVFKATSLKADCTVSMVTSGRISSADSSGKRCL